MTNERIGSGSEPEPGARCSTCEYELDPTSVIDPAGGDQDAFRCPGCNATFDESDESVVVAFDDVSIDDPTLNVNADGTVTIPTYMRDGEAVDTADVDAEWLAQSERVDDANRIATDRLLWLPGVVTIESVNADFEIGDGRRASAVLVTILDGFEGSISLPTEIDGVPLRVETGGPIVDT